MISIKFTKKYSLKNQQAENTIIAKYGLYDIRVRKIFVYWYYIHHYLELMPL